MLGIISAPPIYAQSAQSTAAAARPAFDAFEVATIKPTPPDWRGGRFIRMQAAQQFVARNHSGEHKSADQKIESFESFGERADVKSPNLSTCLICRAPKDLLRLQHLAEKNRPAVS